MALTYSIDITDRAYADLEQISQGILILSGSIESVDKWAKLILEKIYDLNMFPKRNPNTLRVQNLTLWHVTVKHKYVIHYEIIDSEQVVRVWRIMSPYADMSKLDI